MVLQYLRTLLVLLLVTHCSSVHAYTSLSDDSLRSLPSGDADFDIKDGSILSPILIPRVPGTPGSQTVQRHLVDFFTAHLPLWRIEFQNSSSTTPVTGNKQVPFVNIIITRDPPWTKPGDVGRLALVAHYDSKLTPTGFIGATDSAAPCAMIMHAARSVDNALTKKWAAMEAAGDIGLDEEKGVQILFLDGEEAFLSWTNDDSLYGSRSLAESWEAEPHAAMSTYKNPLNSINLFLLLDLLGYKKPSIPSYFETTHWAYQKLGTIEKRLRSLGISTSTIDLPFLRDTDRMTFSGGGGVQDDHLPFMARGVEILHMIPTPFPEVWHTINDDGEHLDMPTVEDWAKIFTAFVAEWMDLEGFMPREPQAATGNGKREVNSGKKTEL
ncbi:glutaminyl-peptide cyclotransferase protein [Rutstroemia sp. NJR-2017a BBW]|nr:glutaminyl-peptide cyclotransferase protein [Rutstroemia sp. NJR-2017a BBW]